MTAPTASVGDVHVDVLPNVDRFATELRSRLASLPNVNVACVPDTSTFRTALRAQLASLPATRVRVSPDTAAFRTALRTQLAAIPPTNVKVSPDTARFRTDLVTRLATMRPVGVGVTPDTTGFRAALTTQLGALRPVGVTVRPDTTGMRADLRARLAAITGLSVRVAASLTPTSLATLHAALAGITGPTVSVTVDITAGLANIAILRAELAAITGPTVHPAVDITAALARVAALQAALAGLTAPTVTPHIGSSAAAGARDAGAYGNAFRAGIAAALRNLPTPTITVATSPAEQAVRDLHTSLQRLGAERVGVSITADQARREITNLRADITRLRAQSPLDVDVDANVGAAELALARLEAQLDAIGREREVNVHDGGSTSRIQRLVTAIAAIGPAAIPAAAAASAALASIGNAAVAGVAGIGVGVLALSGVGGAVKALNQAHADQLKQQASLARQDKTLAGGADQVRSAVASLANTRANAARSVANAERDIIRAQRDALDAEHDLTRARQDAVEALQDLDSQINNNADSIGRAQIDLVKAEKALAAVQNLKVGDERRVEAQLTYNEARHQLDDLTIRQGRLAKEKATADKAGIEGSRQVVDATRRVGDAQEKIRDAEVNAAEARRQAAFSIAQAQQAVVSAQRAMATSAVTTAATAGGATDELRAKLLALSPAGQRFAEFLVSIKDRGLELRNAAQEGFLPGLQRSIQVLLADAPGFEGFLFRVGQGLGGIAERQAHAFTGEQWRPFFQYVSITAVPTVDLLARSLNNAAVGAGNLLVAFTPATLQVNTGLDSMTRRFATWSATLDQNRGFQDFLDYTQTRGPQVVDTIDNVLSTTTHLLEAVAPVGDVVLVVLRGIGNTIQAIPVGVITALYGGFLALKVVNLVSAGVLGLAAAIRAVATSSVTANSAVGRFGAFLGGPLTISIAIAVAAFAAMAAQASESRARVESMTGTFTSYAETLRGGVTPASREATETLLRQSRPLRDIIALAQQAGLSQQQVIDGLNGDRAARDQVIAAIGREIEVQKRIMAEHPAAMGARSDEYKAAEKRVKQLEEERRAYQESAAAIAQAAAISQTLTTATNQQSRASADLAPKIAAQQKLLEALTSSTATAATRADAYRQAIEAYTGAAINSIEAEERMAAAQDQSRAALKAAGYELDIKKAKDAAHRAAILAARDALEEELRATREAMLADIARGEKLDVAKKKQEDRVAAILAAIPVEQRNSAAVQELVKAYGNIPDEVATSMKLTGAEAVLRQLKDLKIAQMSLDLNIDIAAARARVDSGNQWAVFKASGGPVIGPGGPIDDRVGAVLPTQRGPVRYQLSNGEWIHRAAAVDYYGPAAMRAINDLRVPRELLAIGRAAGGPVQDWPFNINVGDIWVPTMEQIRAKLFGAGPGFGNWPSSPSAQRGDSGVWRSVVALMNSSGIPWKFGNAYRPGDPLWHGSGRAVDVMGYNQDALAGFLAARRPLELIHRTNQRDYAYTRGVNKGSFNEALMEAHRNHVHIAMASGGLVDPNDHRIWAGLNPHTGHDHDLHLGHYDSGGTLPPGVTLAYNGTGRDEYVSTADQMRDLVGAGARGGDTHYHLAGLGPEALGQLEAHRDREAIMQRPGRPR